MSRKTFWLVEGQYTRVNLSGEEYEVYYGKNSIRLPFAMHLEKFYKKDYPGSSKTMSFESHIKVNGRGDLVVVSMNEPLKKAGYTWTYFILIYRIA